MHISLLKFKSSIQIGKKDDLGDLLLVADGLVWEFQKLLVVRDFSHTTFFRVQRKVRKRENIQWKKKCWSQWTEETGKTACSREKDNSNSSNHMLEPRYAEEHFWKHKNIEPWSRLATAAEDRTVCLSYQLRRGKRGYNSHKLTKINDAWSEESQSQNLV